MPRAVQVKTFAGFPPAGLEFLGALKENNDRDWFRERKEEYERTVQSPMAQAIVEAAALCRRRGLPLFAKDRNPVMRVYRDIRFTQDKRPFKTHVGASLRRASGPGGHGEVYLHISPEESFVAAGFWMPDRTFLRMWREAAVANTKAFIKIPAGLAKQKLSFSNEGALSRLPRGYDQHRESPIEPFLKLTSYVTVRDLSRKEIRSADLPQTVAGFALAARPLLEWGWNLNYTPVRDILDER